MTKYIPLSKLHTITLMPSMPSRQCKVNKIVIQNVSVNTKVHIIYMDHVFIALQDPCTCAIQITFDLVLIQLQLKVRYDDKSCLQHLNKSSTFIHVLLHKKDLPKYGLFKYTLEYIKKNMCRHLTPFRLQWTFYTRFELAKDPCKDSNGKQDQALIG